MLMNILKSILIIKIEFFFIKYIYDCRKLSDVQDPSQF